MNQMFAKNKANKYSARLEMPKIVLPVKMFVQMRCLMVRPSDLLSCCFKNKGL